MPFRSVKQRKYMWAKHPDIAKRWASEGNNKIIKRKNVKTKRKSK